MRIDLSTPADGGRSALLGRSDCVIAIARHCYRQMGALTPVTTIPATYDGERNGPISQADVDFSGNVESGKPALGPARSASLSAPRSPASDANAPREGRDELFGRLGDWLRPSGSTH
jgi:hypothetical protein